MQSDIQPHMISPVVRFLSKDLTSASVSYVRLMQLAKDKISTCQETRIWSMVDGKDGKQVWKHVHFHKSINNKF